MASSSGNSSGPAKLQNSGSEGDLQVLVEERKRKRMESNRKSARRSRMRKQQHLDDLMGQLAQMRKENGQILATVGVTTQQHLNVEAENSVLRAQMAELSQRLQSLTDIINCLSTNNGGGGGTFDQDLEGITGGYTDNSWNWMYLNQAIMASPADVFQY